jgi:hypothetical protein
MRTVEQGENFDSGVAFIHQDEHPIGEVVPGRIGKSTDEVGCFLRFHFSNSESVQILIDDLIIIRDSIEAVEHSVHPTGLWLCKNCGESTDEPKQRCSVCNTPRG